MSVNLAGWDAGSVSVNLVGWDAGSVSVNLVGLCSAGGAHGRLVKFGVPSMAGGAQERSSLFRQP